MNEPLSREETLFLIRLLRGERVASGYAATDALTSSLQRRGYIESNGIHWKIVSSDEISSEIVALAAVEKLSETEAQWQSPGTWVDPFTRSS